MKQTYRYAYYDLGEREEGTIVKVTLRGAPANVLLLTPLNFNLYRTGQPFSLAGGHYRTSPVRLSIPRDGQWYVVVDTGGYARRVEASVDVVAPQDREPADEQATDAVQA